MVYNCSLLHSITVDNIIIDGISLLFGIQQGYLTCSDRGPLRGNIRMGTPHCEL